MASIEVKNDSGIEVLFAVFNQGDAGFPFSTQWTKPGQSVSMEIGDFKRVGVGVQAQTAGTWLSSPLSSPTFTANQKCVFSMSKAVG